VDRRTKEVESSNGQHYRGLTDKKEVAVAAKWRQNSRPGHGGQPGWQLDAVKGTFGLE